MTVNSNISPTRTIFGIEVDVAGLGLRLDLIRLRRLLWLSVVDRGKLGPGKLTSTSQRPALKVMMGTIDMLAEVVSDAVMTCEVGGVNVERWR